MKIWVVMAKVEELLSNDGQRQRILQKLGNDFLKSII